MFLNRKTVFFYLKKKRLFYVNSLKMEHTEECTRLKLFDTFPKETSVTCSRELFYLDVLSFNSVLCTKNNFELLRKCASKIISRKEAKRKHANVRDDLN